MENQGILKFANKIENEHTRTGIRTFPQQTYGVSKESPDHFQQTHTIITPNGYYYRHEQAPEFEYHSQQKSLMLA